MGCEYTSDLPITGDVTIANQPIDVHIVGSGGNSTNVYSQVLVPYATITTILTFVVATATFNISSFIGWGDTCGEFLVKVNGVTKGGGRTTAATPTFTADYIDGPIPTLLGDVITITAEHYTITSHIMKANLLGG